MSAKNTAQNLNRAFMGEDEYYDSLSAYLDEHALETLYVQESPHVYSGVLIYLTLGGPTIWVDTVNHIVVCHDGGAFDVSGIWSDICDEINAWAGIEV